MAISVITNAGLDKASANGTGAIQIPSGSSAQRPNGGVSANGMIRYNETIGSYEGYSTVGGWSPIAGAGANATTGIMTSSATITSNTVIPTGFNALSVGPIVIPDGITVTIANGSTWVIV